MSLHKELNITESTMEKYTPLRQLSSKYLNQVIKRSQVMTFNAGETIFEKNHELPFTYYLLKGELKIKKGLLSSETLNADSKECLHPINKKIPSETSVKATQSGHILMVDTVFLDRALGWTEAEAVTEKDKEKETVQAESEEISVEEEPAEFDPEHFDWMASLLSFPLFFNLPPSNMETIFNKFERVKVKEGEVVIKDGDEGDFFYLLVEGSAKVLIGGDGGKQFHLSKGSYFGEEALVSDTLRSATVIMNEDGVLARLDKTSFQSLLHDPLVQCVSTAEFKEQSTSGMKKTALLDIRSLDEFEFAPMPQCLHIPLSELRQKIPTLDKSTTYYLTSEGGQRSDIAAHVLCQNSIEVYVIKD
ncbi:protein kinase [Hahella sp. CCB-MM4]|uniref:cyclic nucleotide-binding domain-containing protein n=1 Tax=Hahella sp. (strain CCB-MM4) TaxID=1926491 RepID=UPI000B9C3BF7|nr:cyclic nucleotide-binding domain-containing protein [Hahella sp. CCB-MM4]OZG70995.1 protein kinase [Hahella sp. CCB-MM4]